MRRIISIATLTTNASRTRAGIARGLYLFPRRPCRTIQRPKIARESGMDLLVFTKRIDSIPTEVKHDGLPFRTCDIHRAHSSNSFRFFDLVSSIFDRRRDEADISAISFPPSDDQLYSISLYSGLHDYTITRGCTTYASRYVANYRHAWRFRPDRARARARCFLAAPPT